MFHIAKVTRLDFSQHQGWYESSRFIGMHPFAIKGQVQGHFTHKPRVVTMYWWGPFILIQRPYHWYGIPEFVSNLPLGGGPDTIPVDRETLSIVCHVGIHVDFSSMIIASGPWAFTFKCVVNLESLHLFNQWEILECNGQGPTLWCVKWPLVPQRALYSDTKEHDANIFSLNVAMCHVQIH